MRVTLLALALLVACANPSGATWSIVAVDTETQEVVVGAATCVTGLDLQEVLPVVLVGEGGGAAQSAIDGSGERRLIIHDGIELGLTSEEIVDQLLLLSGTASHQHGVAETGGSSATQTGASNGAHASGIAGSFGRVFYAIQGNVLTGSPVITQAELALVDTLGDLPEKLMVSMEAARAMGGDGRCSCAPGDPTGCGAPPPMFDKAAHIGFMIVSRFGDTDDPACTSGGCADGDYFMGFNVAFQGQNDPDPVLQLRALFDSWRVGLQGRPDAIATILDFLPTGGDFLLRIEVKDWQGVAVGTGIVSLTVEHAPGSDEFTDIGTVTDLGGGIYEVPLTRNGAPGTADIFVVTIDDGIRPVVLPPHRATLNLVIFTDGFESGDTTAWSSTVP